MSAKTTYLEWLENYHKDPPDLEVDFAASPWGMRERWEDCGIEGDCPSPNCNDMGNSVTTIQGAAAYLIMLQMMHINQVCSFTLLLNF